MSIDRATGKTFCNPLPIPNFGADQEGHSMGAHSLADPMVFRHGKTWYLFVSGAQAWTSDDLVNWTYHRVDLPPGHSIGPTVLEHDGRFYLSANGNRSMLRADNPLGPWSAIGPILDVNGNKTAWVDVQFFKDDDGRVYCYHGSGVGIGTDGVFVTELDPAAQFLKALGPSKQLFPYVKEHVWERWGGRNEFPTSAWIEAPWVTKHEGRYYLQYSASGTEWDTYAVGLYTSDSPTGPFVYDERSPILCCREGLLRGPGHHAVVRDEWGHYWVVYHVLMRNTHQFDRRLAVDPAGFDGRGRMVMRGPTDVPQLIPGVAADPVAGNTAGWSLLSLDKPVTASSSAAGRTPSYCVDGYPRTWWEAAGGGLPQHIEVDLQGEFTVRACRIIFAQSGADKASPAPYRYRLGVSQDRTEFQTVLDKSGNDVHRDIEYDETAAVLGRYVRLTVNGAPKGMPLGIVDFSVFGTA